MRLIVALMIVTGVVVALIPHYIFPVCQYEGKFVETKGGGLIPMRCTYTARVETIIGVGLTFVSLMLLIAREKETRVFLSIVIAAKGLAVILVPEFIGFCQSPMMPCVSGTVPALRIAGGAVFLLSLISLFIELKGKKATGVD